MKQAKLHYLILFLLCMAPAASAQYISVSAGGLFSQSLSAAAPAAGIGAAPSANFNTAAIIAVDGGFGVLPFLGLNLHYSHSRPELTLRRGDAFGSSAVVDLGANTLTLDARLHTPQFFGVRAYGFLGVGFSRFSVDVKSQIESPFPTGLPGTLTSPIGTYGGGLQKKLAPLLGLKLEVRDYVTSIPSNLYAPQGTWHRVAILAGVVLGH